MNNLNKIISANITYSKKFEEPNHQKYKFVMFFVIILIYYFCNVNPKYFVNNFLKTNVQLLIQKVHNKFGTNVEKLNLKKIKLAIYNT